MAIINNNENSCVADNIVYVMATVAVKLSEANIKLSNDNLKQSIENQWL